MNQSRLNLSTKAIDAFKKYSQLTDDKPFFEWLIFALASSQKFILPDNGIIMEGLEPARYTDLFRMPFPATALEYNAKGECNVDDIECLDRIALCLTPRSDAILRLPSFLELPSLEDDEGFYVLSLFANDGAWGLAPAMALVRTGAVSVIKRGGSGVNVTFHPLPFGRALEIYAEMSKKDGIDINDLFGKDLRDETNAAMSFAATMSCSNVEKDTIEVSPKLNKKRAKNGKTELFPYHILKLSLSSDKKTTGTKGTGTGHGTSPRQHLRRGHPRRYPDNVIWINSTVVGEGEMVDKEYHVS